MSGEGDPEAPSEARHPAAWTVLIWPDGAEPTAYTFTGRQVRWLRRLVVALAVSVLLLLTAAVFALPRVVAFPSLVEENLVLRQHIAELDQTMDEVDRVLLRLRVYESQLHSLTQPEGEHGPLPEGALAQAPMETRDTGGLDAAEPEALRPAEAWATAVRARAETFLTLAEDAEPDLNEVMAELEDLRALEEALPSRWPAEGDFTSGFGFRASPFGRTRMRFHSGLDIANRRGTPIHAAAPGIVRDVSYNMGYGRVLELDHGFGITTVYAHCTRILVREGAEVAEGDMIATIGTTGRSTGPHLHFEVRIDDHPVDPLDYLPRSDRRER